MKIKKIFICLSLAVSAITFLTSTGRAKGRLLEGTHLQTQRVMARSFQEQDLANGMERSFQEQDLANGMERSLGFQDLANGMESSLGFQDLANGMENSLEDQDIEEAMARILGFQDIEEAMAHSLGFQDLEKAIVLSLEDQDLEKAMARSLEDQDLEKAMARSLKDKDLAKASNTPDAQGQERFYLREDSDFQKKLTKSAERRITGETVKTSANYNVLNTTGDGFCGLHCLGIVPDDALSLIDHVRNQGNLDGNQIASLANAKKAIEKLHANKKPDHWLELNHVKTIANLVLQKQIRFDYDRANLGHQHTVRRFNEDTDSYNGTIWVHFSGNHYSKMVEK